MKLLCSFVVSVDVFDGLMFVFFFNICEIKLRIWNMCKMFFTEIKLL